LDSKGRIEPQATSAYEVLKNRKLQNQRLSFKKRESNQLPDSFPQASPQVGKTECYHGGGSEQVLTVAYPDYHRHSCLQTYSMHD